MDSALLDRCPDFAQIFFTELEKATSRQSRTAEALRKIGESMDKLAAETPLGPWREPRPPVVVPTQAEMSERIVKRMAEMNERMK
jgi:hypothetical protein